ncbi:hypothetical protein CAAN1_20S00122 [[Candida] anglica]|uniref:AAA+ ATPase domain-containing protein n=1 Tax=[Candida] anglica TaxID=148631 RepID=A0ABP0EFV7_9ASCO
MFLRKKPPPLTPSEELISTYNDCCDITFRNLNLEEQNNFDGALKGWKSLHTSLLYKIDTFEKQAPKFDQESLDTFQELKALRDQNIKHLIRVQMRLDELDRRSSNANLRPSIQRSNNTNNSSSSMSVPSLRNNKNAPSSRSLSSASQPRQMLKSLRPGVPSNNSKQSFENASKAASASWRTPNGNGGPSQSIPSQQYYSSSTDPSIDQFADFDQWERTSDSPPPLIDLSNDLQGLGLSNGTHSMDDLRLKAPAPPPPRKRSSEQSRPSNEPRASSPVKQPQRLAQGSKSTPDVRTTSTAKYSYTKPKPFNVNEMMRAQAKRNANANAASASKSIPKVKSPPTSSNSVNNSTNNNTHTTAYKTTTIPKIYVKKPATTKPSVATTKSKGPTGPTIKPTNTLKPIKKTSNVINSPPEIHSPTMDDILGGYDDKDEDAIINGDQQVDLVDENVLTSEQEDELISSIRGIDETAAKQILNDIVVHGDEVHWNDIAGLESAKNSLKEAVVYPFLRPDLFSGLREPARGLLLFGPPGTGKTMLARAVATESKSTFFAISASSLTSKYLGESEKLVKALFLLARKLSPSIVFVDEIDSLLSTRTEGEVESSRRIKNEFLIQWSELSSAAAGRDTNSDGDVTRVLILGATNVPWAIDEAARRRFVRRQYIPLPEAETRRVHLRHLLDHQKHTLSESDFEELVKLTIGFSGSDITALAKDAAMGPLRSLGDMILNTPRDQIRPVSLADFVASLQYIRPSVSTEGLKQHEDWATKYGSWGG